ncbi:MAG: transporter, partial [Solirubrobacteraceae bacterium]
LTSLNYQYIKEKIALQIGTDYIIKTENSNNYKFGNQWNSSLTGYYFFKISKININPKIGLVLEIFESNIQLAEKIPKTSGEVFLGKAGVELNYKNLTLGNELALPIYANLANKDIQPISRFSFFMSYNF